MVIFITGISIAVKKINAPLNTPQESQEIRKDSLNFKNVKIQTV